MLDEELNPTRWRKSSYSGLASNCVEVASVRSAVAVRDTKNRCGAVLEFSAARWSYFLDALR